MKSEILTAKQMVGKVEQIPYTDSEHSGLIMSDIHLILHPIC